MPPRRVSCVTGYRSGVSSHSHSRDSTAHQGRVLRDFSLHRVQEDLNNCGLYGAVNKLLENDNSEKNGVNSEEMEPLYATVRKRSSPPRQQNMFVPQVPLNIQPNSQAEYFHPEMDQFTYEQNHFREKVGFQPVHGYEGFRPMPARHFRQNTWGSGYQVMIVYMFRVKQCTN